MTASEDLRSLASCESGTCGVCPRCRAVAAETSPSPFDTIREALELLAKVSAFGEGGAAGEALAALTEVKQQLAIAVGTVDQLQKTAEYQEARAVAAETALAKHREASAITIRKMGEALDRAQQKVRDQEGRFTNPYRSDLDRAVAAETALADMTAERDRLQTILTTRSFSTTESGADRIAELETALAATRPIQWPSASTEVQFCLHERRCLELREAEARVVAAEKALAEAEDGRDALVDEIQREYVLRSTHLAIVGAAERRANDLADALRDFEAAVRVYDVMLNEPAAGGLMSAEDYSAYLRGAWLGVEEAAVAARAALDRHTERSGT